MSYYVFVTTFFLMSTFTLEPVLFWMDLPLLSSLTLISIFSNTSLPRDFSVYAILVVMTLCSIIVFHFVNLTMVMLHVLLFFLLAFFTLYYVVFHLMYERKLKAC